jgi:hypothetical protein
MFRSSSSGGFPSKVCRSDGVAAPVEDTCVESKLIWRNTRSMLFRMRLAGPVESGETGLDLSDLMILLCDIPRALNAGADNGVPGGAEPGGEAARLVLLVLIVERGFPPIGNSGSRLCFILFGAENCLLNSSSLAFRTSCVVVACAPPTDSGAVDVGACVLPERFSELCERRGLIGWSWKRPGSGAIIARPFDEDSVEPVDEGREN